MAGNNTATAFEPIDQVIDSLGGGESLVGAQAADFDHQLKSIVGGTGVTVSSTATEITIASNLRVTDVTTVADITARDAITGMDEGDVAIVTAGTSGSLETYIWDGAAWTAMDFGADVSASRAVNTGGGLTGGGDLTADRTLALDITNQTDLAAAPDNADEFIVWDDSASAFAKVSYADLLSNIAEVDTLQTVFDRGQAITIADTDNQTFAITNSDVTNNPDTATITNATTGTGLLVDQNANGVALNVQNSGDQDAVRIDQATALAANQSALFVDSGVAQVNAPLTWLRNTNAGTTQSTLEVESAGTGDGIFVDQNGDGTGIHVDSEATTAPGVIVDIVDGDAHIRLVGDSGNATPTEGDFWREADGLKYFDGTTEHNLLDSGASDLAYTASPTQGIVTNTNGNDATLPAVDATNAGLMLPGDKTKVDFITVTQAVDLDEMEAESANLVTLSGVASDAVDLGTFTGTTVTDNVTIKAALQELETAVEANDGVASVAGVLGAAATSVDVAHGLSFTPNLVDVQATLNNKTLIQNVYVTAVDATNVTVEALRVPGAAQNFSLMIKRP